MGLGSRILLGFSLSAALFPSLFAQDVKPDLLRPALRPYSPAEFRRTVQFQRSISDTTMLQPGVEGTAISLENGRPRLIVYVSKTAFSADVTAIFDAAERSGINAEVVEVQGFEALQAKMGTSTAGNDACAAGTLGMAVRQGNKRGYLTNAHVAAIEDEQLGCPNGPMQEQVAPGRFDRNCGASTKVGKLVKATPIPTDRVTPGTVDAAFIEEISGAIDPRNECGVCPSDLTIIDPNEAANAKLDVVACGRGTPAKRSGKVLHIEGEIWVRFNCQVRAKFQNQIIVDGMAAPSGYSGAVAYGTEKGVLGLIFAGDGKLTALNPMERVLSELGVTIDTSRPCR